MKKLLLAVFFAMLSVTGYAQNIRQIVQTNDLTTAQQQPKPISWFQGETVQYDIWVERDENVVSLNTGTTFAVWYVTAATNLSLTYIVNTGILANATNGHVRITTTASEANLPTNTYESSVRLYDVSGGVTSHIGTIARGKASVYWSPDVASYSIVTGQVVTTLVFNVTLNSGTNGGGSGNATSIYGMGISATVTGASVNDVLMWDGTNWYDAALTAYATVANLSGLGVVVTNIQGQVTTNLTRLGLSETNHAGLGVVVTNQQGQITTNLTRLGASETNIVGIGVVATNIQGQVTTNLTSAGATSTNLAGFQVVTTNALGVLTTNLIANGLADTNNQVAQGLISTNLAGFQVVTTNALGVLTTNLLLNGLADTNNLIADGLTQTNLVRAGLIHTNFVGLTATNLNALGLQVTNDLTSQGLIGTNLTANGLQITNNLIAQGLINTQLIANGLADTNLSGRVTTNLTAQGLIATNLVAVGLQVTNNLAAQGLIATNLTANGLYATNTQGQVTTNLTRLGLAETNHIGLGVVVTNNLTAQGLISTNLATLNGSAVSKTSTPGQVMSSDLRSLGTLHANTNLVAADTNSVGGELLTGGAFTGSAAGWALTNASYNANNVLVLPSAVATITYTQNTPIVGGKAYLVSWDNTLAYGTNFTTFTLSLGGVTNAMGNSPTGTTARLFQAFTAQNPVWTVAPDTNQWVGDNLSVKQVTAGNLLVAKDGTIGERLVVGGSIATTGSVTAGSFSGTSTSFVLRTGSTSTGPQTGTAFFASSYSVAGLFGELFGTENGSIFAGADSSAAGANSAAFGSDSHATGDRGMAFGNNNTASGDSSAAIGGVSAEASGSRAITIGGNGNAAAGSDSIAIGGKSKSTNTGAIVFSDNTGTNYGSHGDNTFNVRANGGVWVSQAQVFDGLGRHMGDASQLTNLPAATSTNSVGGIKVSEATNVYVGTVPLNSSATIQFSATATGPTASVLSGALTGINGAGVTGAIPLSAQGVGTGSVGVAVNLGITNAAAGTINGTYPNINIGTNDSQGSATGTLFRVESQHANLIVTTNNGPTASFTLSGVATGTPLYAEANVPTNALLPTSLAIGAGDTCLVVRTGANLFSIVATSTPTTISFDTTWTTGHVGTCLIELYAGTNSIAFPTSVVHNVGRASSTNLTIGTTTTTELLFQKPIGSIWRVIQLTP